MKKRGKNEYYENIMYSLYVLRLTSVFPFEFQKSERTWTQILSTILSFVSVTVYCLVVQNSIIFFHDFFTKAMDNLDFKEVVALLSALYIRFFFLVMPVLSWGKGHRLRTYIDHWRLFQIEFQIVSAQHLINKSARRKIKTSFLIGFIISPILDCSIIYSTSLKGLTMLILMSAIVYTHYFLVIYWYINGAIIVSTMETFLTELEHSLKIGDYRKLKKFMHIWMKLRDLTDEFQQSNSSLFLGHLGLILTHAVVQIYFIMNFLSGQIEERPPLVVALVITDIIFIHLYMDVAEKILFKMTSEVQHTLLSKNIMYIDPQLIKEVWHFLDIIWTNPPRIDLNGYFTMARSVFLSIVAAALNFVIVIRQFGMYKLNAF